MLGAFRGNEQRINAALHIYGLGIDRPLAQLVGSATSYFVADHLGSIAQVTDSAGAPSLTREYDPWGNLLQGSTAGGYAFTGREWESETNLYYYRARYYDAKVGRFVSEDPLGLSAGVNRYAYVRNYAVGARDPSGKYTLAASAEPYKDEIEYAMKILADSLPKQTNRCCLKYFEKRGANPIQWTEFGAPPEIRVVDLPSTWGGRTAEPFDYIELDVDMIRNQGIHNLCECAQIILHEFGHFVGKKPKDGFVKACTFGCLNPEGDDDY